MPLSPYPVLSKFLGYLVGMLLYPIMGDVWIYAVYVTNAYGMDISDRSRDEHLDQIYEKQIFSLGILYFFTVL